MLLSVEYARATPKAEYPFEQGGEHPSAKGECMRPACRLGGKKKFPMSGQVWEGSGKWQHGEDVFTSS